MNQKLKYCVALHSTQCSQVYLGPGPGVLESLSPILVARTCEEAGQLQRAVPAAGRGVLQHVGPDGVRLLRGAPGGVVRD